MDPHADLYSVLGVAEEASEDELKRAFRRLSLAYHPDRWQAPQDKREAGERFLHVARAYGVLSDERKRMAYDELGPRDFEQGQQLLTAEVDSAAKLRARFEREKRRVAEQAYHGKLRMSGSLVVGASASDLLAPADPDLPLGERLWPHISSVSMSEDMALALSQRTALTCGCQLLTKGGLGGCTLRLGFKRQLGHHAFLHASASGLNGSPAPPTGLNPHWIRHYGGVVHVGSPLSVGLSASRRLSRHSNGGVSASLSPRGLADLVDPDGHPAPSSASATSSLLATPAPPLTDGATHTDTHTHSRHLCQLTLPHTPE